LFDQDDYLREICWAAVRRELDKKRRNRNKRNQNMLLEDWDSRKEAFESLPCFGYACLFLQCQYKFLTHSCLGTDDNLHGTSSSFLFLEDFLYGSCREFIRRITEYALMSQNVEQVKVIVKDQANEEKETPTFYHAFDFTQRQIVSSKVDWGEDDDGSLCSRAATPLQTMRNTLPFGAVLTKLWTLTTPREESEQCNDIAEQIQTFMSLVKEHTLTICGVPFKVLDKKLEKKLLAARSQQLLEKIQETNDLETILDLSIMLLFQQHSKHNFVVVVHTGNRAHALEKLSDERKKLREQVQLLDMLTNVSKALPTMPLDESSTALERLRSTVLDGKKHSKH